MKVVQKQQRAEADEDHGTDGTPGAPGLERVGRNFSEIPCLRGAHGFEGAVENEPGEENGEHGAETAIEITRQADNNRSKKRDLDQPLVVLPLVDSAESWKQAEDKRGRRAAPA